MDQQKVRINCAIEDLLLKINQKEQRDFKGIVEVIVQLARWCRGDAATKPIVIQCFVQRLEAIIALVTMIDDICTG